MPSEFERQPWSSACSLVECQPAGEKQLMTTRRSCAPALLFCAAVALTAGSAEAQTRQGPRDQRPYGGSYQQQPAWDNGYRAGLSEGERDARAGRQFDVRSSRTYRSADRGYDRRYGARDRYRDVFREGYAAGYRAGYDGGRSGRAVPRDGRYGDPRYGGPGYGRHPGYGRGGALYSVASDRGYADGYGKGLDDVRSRRRFDPTRHKWYRSGDRGYNRQYGPRDDYRIVYRDAFQAGYERAFRERGAYGSRYPGRSGGWGWPF
jgi:hypothetical protein